MVSLQSLAGARPVHWLTLSAAILIVDYATGPYIQFPILFVFPVALAVAGQGRPVGIAVATFLPLFRLTFYLDWPLPASWTLQIVDSSIDVVILMTGQLPEEVERMNVNGQIVPVLRKPLNLDDLQNLLQVTLEGFPDTGAHPVHLAG